jgi:hypothetical protein
VSAKEGLKVIYLFDVSGSFHNATKTVAINSAIEIFNLIIDRSQGIPEYPQVHFVSTITAQSINIGGFCSPTIINRPSLYNMGEPDISNFLACIEKIRKHPKSPETDIYGALHQCASILSSKKLRGKAIIMYTDLMNECGRDTSIIQDIDLSDIIVVVLYEYNQKTAVNTKLLKEARVTFENNLKQMRVKKYKIEHLVSVEPSEIVEFLERSFR